MEREFLKLYDKVFDAAGNIKPCGRNTCAVLIEEAMKLEPQADRSFYSDCDSGSKRFGTMNVQNIKALRAKIT